MGFHYSRVFRGSEVVNCALLNDMNLTARDVLSHKALNRELSELEVQWRKDREELASKIEKLKADMKRTARLQEDVWGEGKNQGKNSRTAERESISSSGRSPKSICSPKMGGAVHKKRK